MKTISKFDRFSLFTFSWAVATTMHTLSFSNDIRLFSPFTWLSSFVAIFLILNPRSVYLFVLMLFCSIIKSIQWLPYTPNHILFELIINTGMFVTLIVLYFKYRFDWNAGNENDWLRNEIFISFAPFVRISLLILYFYAVFHKLNWDYFNPQISCGSFLLEGFGSRLPHSISQNYFIRVGSVWGTLVTETVIPLFLLFRRTRNAGILLGMGFHFFLSGHPHPGLYSFSALLFGLYCLFLSPDFPDKLETFAQSFFGKNWMRIAKGFRYFMAGIIGFAFVIILVGFVEVFHSVFKSGLLIWIIWAVIAITIFTAVISKYKLAQEDFSTAYYLKARMYWIIPLLVFLNGLCPYLGLKTQTSFSMFSNLRTEGGITNHLFMPVSLHLTSLEEDLVEITSTNYEHFQEYNDRSQLITFFEFHREASEVNKDFFVEYKRNGQLQRLEIKNGISSNTEITTPLNIFSYKFIRFRPIDKGPCLCKH
jgi:hypothetical protein